jgi:deoxyuridine 5'-triphosphate nucleotidohydrolase
LPPPCEGRNERLIVTVDYKPIKSQDNVLAYFDKSGDERTSTCDTTVQLELSELKLAHIKYNQTMHSFKYDPPTLLIDDEIVRGINIIDRLHAIRNESEELYELYAEVSSLYQRTRVPGIGFRLADPLAVMPSKRIIDVGYDLTVVSVAKQLTPLTTMFETFVSVDIPLGYYVEVVPRSSLSKTGYMLANGTGIIDPGYTGTLKVALIKVDPSTPALELPARVCQIILKQYVVSDAYDSTGTRRITSERGAGGFGSTD